MNVYAVATPAVLVVVGLEAAYCLYQKNGYYRFDDAMANFATAIGHQITNVAVAAGVFALFTAIHSRWPVAEWGGTPLSFAALYLSIDFLFYWFHRAGHGINILWAAHAAHHSSEEMNYTVGLRASLTQRAASFLFYWPLAFVAKPDVVLPLAGLHLLFQLIPHTRVITRVPRWIESWLNTPTHHRVHHGMNPKYIDRNFGGTFIVWDKMFGTYAEEIEPVVYGVLRPVGTFNPILINLQYWNLLWVDAVAAPRWTDKVKLWFMPNGWRPGGIPARAPLISVFGREKLRADPSMKDMKRMALQLPFLLLAMWMITRHDSPLGDRSKVALGAIVWVFLIGWGETLDAARKLSPKWDLRERVQHHRALKEAAGVGA